MPRIMPIVWPVLVILMSLAGTMALLEAARYNYPCWEFGANYARGSDVGRYCVFIEDQGTYERPLYQLQRERQL